MESNRSATTYLVDRFKFGLLACTSDGNSILGVALLVFCISFTVLLVVPVHGRGNSVLVCGCPPFGAFAIGLRDSADGHEKLQQLVRCVSSNMQKSTYLDSR
jgi:hypothetical protein